MKLTHHLRDGFEWFCLFAWYTLEALALFGSLVAICAALGMVHLGVWGHL